MGKPLATRTKPIILSSDDEDDHGNSKPPKETKERPLGTQGSLVGDGKLPKKAPSISRRKSKGKQPTASVQQGFDAPKPSSEGSQDFKTEKARPKAKTIHSFFNTAVVQLQQSQREGTSLVHDAKPQEDFIDDDSLDEEILRAEANGFEVEVHSAKRAREAPTNGLPSESEQYLGGSQKFRKTHSGLRASVLPSHQSRASEDGIRPWNERFAPKDFDELAVHTRKVADVRRWLQNVLYGRDPKRLLVLKGSAGTGKTTTVKMLSEQLNFDIHEWTNPVSTSDSEQRFVSTMSHLEDFICRIGKHRGLNFDGENSATGFKQYESSEEMQMSRRVLLIEEFPNTFTGSSSATHSLRAVVHRYLAANCPVENTHSKTLEITLGGATPIILIISESLQPAETFSTDNFTAHRLLGPELLNHPGVTVIEFNRVAPTILEKALELIIKKEARITGRRKAPGPQVMKYLAETGDIRNAVSTLEFLCLRGDDDDGWGARVAFTKSKRNDGLELTNMERTSLEAIQQRESNLDIFHAVGKIVYNKRERNISDHSVIQPPAHLPQHRRPHPPEVCVDNLISELGTDIQTFVAALFENYVPSCEGSTIEDTIDYFNGCVECLSDTDILSPSRFSNPRLNVTFQSNITQSLRQDEVSFQVSVRGLLFNLPSPVKRNPQSFGKDYKKGDAYKMFYPSSVRLWREQQVFESLLDSLTLRVQSGSDIHSPVANGLSSAANLDGVTSWAQRASTFQTEPSVTQSNEDTAGRSIPLMSGGNSARRELLLERVPYMMAIFQKRSSDQENVMLRDIEKLTTFNGTAATRSDSPEELDLLNIPEPSVEFNKRHKSFGTSPSKSNRQNKGKDLDGQNKSFDSRGRIFDAQTVDGLVISDDDIEDD